MRGKIGALLGASMIACAWGQVTTAQASEIGDPVGCSNSNRIGPIWEAGAQAAQNSIGPFDQDIIVGVGSYSFCAGDRARLKFEGLVANVDDGIGSSQSYVIGAGVSFQVAPGLVLAPTVYVGYEDIHTGDDQEVGTIALPATYTAIIDGGERDSYFIVEARPEYVFRQAANPSSFGTSIDEETFVAFAGIGYDMPLADGLRGRLKLGQRYIDTDLPTDSITYLTASIGGENRYGGYGWIADVIYSEGNGDYNGLLIGLTFRGVSG